MADRGAGRAALGHGRRSSRRPRWWSRSAATRAGPPSCSPRRCASSGADGWSPSTRSSTGRLFGGSPTRDDLRAEHRGRRAHRRPWSCCPSTAPGARPGGPRRIDHLYIDGKHDYWTLSDDLRWTQHLPAGSAGADPRLLLLDRGHARHPRARPALATADLRAAGRLPRALPGRPTDDRGPAADRWRAPVVAAQRGLKVLLRLRLRPVARLFGHDSPYDPY